MFTDVAIEQNVLLKPFTTLQVGGPAKFFLRAKTTAQLITALKEAKRNNIPVCILGGGSNVLISDQGFNGLVIKLELIGVEISGAIVQAQAGTLINAVIRKSTQAGLSGLEFATGVPASVGGAVWANLGCRGSEIAKVIEEVEVVNDSGTQSWLKKSDCDFKYRHSIFKDNKSLVIVSAKFKLSLGDSKQLRQDMVALTQLKKTEQNVGDYTAGCAFRNPTGTNQSASQLIDQLGLKGFTIGGAMVSTKHANFIVNTGTATADHIIQLISYIKQQVRDKCGVQLQEEIEYIGF